MIFDYNDRKSADNLEKHGLSLADATALWLVPAVIVPARTEGEERFMIIGKINEKLYSCIFTMRKDIVRLISARRSRSTEEVIYHEKVTEKDQS